MEENSEAKSSNHSSADAITACEDAMSEILLRLPVKSVIRFQLVSKESKDFISRPHFRKRHKLFSLKRNPDFLLPRGLFFHHPASQHMECVPIPWSDTGKTKSTSHFPSLSFLESAFGSLVSVVHSCNGLLLCRVVSRYRFHLSVCNMTTQEFALVPQPPDHPESRMDAYALAFNPLESPYYGIVCLRGIHQGDPRDLKRDRVEILVYSSENGTWKSRCCLESRMVGELWKPVAYWNGSVVWEIKDCSYFRLYLNEEELKLKPINPPGDRSCDYKFQAAYLGEWCGHLHSVYIQRDSDDDFQVLEFEEFSSQWYVKYTGNIAHIVKRFPGTVTTVTPKRGPDKTIYVFAILAVVRGDREEDSALLLAIPRKVISYNFMLKTVEVVRELPEKVCFTYSFSSFPYIESLYPV